MMTGRNGRVGAKVGCRSRCPRALRLALRCGGACALIVAALALAPGLAAAKDTVINFDDQPGGTEVTTQYSGLGVTFNQTSQGIPDPAGRATIESVGAAGAHSGSQVASIRTGTNEFPSGELWGHFGIARQHVSMFVGQDASQAGVTATLEAFDLSHHLVSSASVDIPAAPVTETPLSVSVPSAGIYSFHLTSNSNFAVVDDISFDAPSTPPPPDFALTYTPPPHYVSAAPGHSAEVTVGLDRNQASIGRIGFTVSQLPVGVTASVAPNPATAPGTSPITVTFTVAPNAPPETLADILVTGTALDRSAGDPVVPRSVEVQLAVVGPFDLRAQGIEVTQGIQHNGILIPSGAGSGGSYAGFNVPLVQQQLTAVRFYADAHGAPRFGIPDVTAVLRGYRNGEELPGSPLLPTQAPAALVDSGEPNPPVVFPSERTSDTNAFTFVLPDSWTKGSIQLRATVMNPYPRFTGLSYAECSDAACSANDTFVVNDVAFTPTPRVTIAPYEERQPGDAPMPSPAAVFKRALTLEPGGNNFVVLPYQGLIDTTDMIHNPTKYDPGGDLHNSFLDAVLDRADADNPDADFVVGVERGQRSATMDGAGIYHLPLSNPRDLPPHRGIATVSPDQPLTSVMHELGHMMGRNHADEPPPYGCGGYGGPWPPDRKGEIEGIGLDLSTSPFRIIAPGLPGEPAQWYDIMSYCTGGDDSVAWESDRGWEHDIDALTSLQQRALAAAPDQRSARVSATPSLFMLGIVSAAGARIDQVIPTDKPPPTANPGPFQLVARDANGHTVATGAVNEFDGHSDPGSPFLMLEGSVPASGASSIQLVDQGSVIATRTRSLHRPRVKILTPKAGAKIGGQHQVTVRWRATDADRDPLTITIGYSVNDGRDWRGIYAGPNRTSIKLPNAFFSGSRRARLRIAANDGFNQTQVVSRPFIALGAPPTVQIITPDRGQSVASGTLLNLAGRAVDDAGSLLHGRSLRWSVDGVLIGHGEAVVSRRLSVGADHIVLRARDARGRTSSTSVLVHVEKPDLPFLRLIAPKAISRRAQRLSLRASSALPAKLTIGHRTFALTKKARRISIRIARGRRAVLIQLTITVRGLSHPVTLRVPRRRPIKRLRS